MKMFTAKTFATLLALFLATGSPASAQFFARFTNPKVEVTMTHPPGFPLSLERAAVVPRGDDCAEEFGDTVVALFARQGVDLVDRQNIETVLAEQDLGASGYVDADTAVELGQVLGSAALILVTTQRCDEEQNRSSERVKTLSGDERTKYTAKTEGFFKGSVRVVDLATARIFAAQTVDGRSTLENTSYDGYPESPSRYDARDAALSDALVRVHRMFFPWDERRNLYFFNDDECNLKAAFKLLKIDDVAGAAELSAENLEICKTADVKPKFLARAYYNLGMARLLQSRYDEALEYLEQAYRRDGGSIIADSIEEARRAQRLAAQMAELEDSAALGPEVAQARNQAQPTSGASEAAEGGGASSLAARLEQLETLLDQGLISQKEYDEKRQEILGDI